MNRDQINALKDKTPGELERIARSIRAQEQRGADTAYAQGKRHVWEYVASIGRYPHQGH